jgi:HSP20 family protein
MTLTSFNRIDPVQGILELQRELDRFLGRPQGWDVGVAGAGVFPPINLFADRNGVVVRAEVPGVEPNSIDVSIQRNTLSVSGERPIKARGKGSYHRRERRFGKFSRSIQLPLDLDTERAHAECRNGVLTLRIPRREEAKPRQVKINV